MKKLLTVLVAVALVGSTLFTWVPTTYAADNLIANPSVEITNESGGAPEGWQSNQWGALQATFSYVDGGKTGSRSVRVDVSNYQDGDAKWYFSPVAVQAGETYVYQTHYKSSTATEVVAQITNIDGSVSYQWLKTAAVNTGDWQLTTAEFKTPASAQLVSIFHVVAANGWLQTDDVSLRAKQAAPQIPDDALLSNGSLEQADASNEAEPANWSHNTWGENTAQFTYENNGQSGGRSVRTEILSYSSGDAKWFVDPVTVKSNQQYVYKQFFKANVETQVVAAYIDANGNYTYEWLKSVPANANWSEMTVQFKTSAQAKKVSLYHVVNSVGWLQIDTVSLTESADTPSVPSTNPIANQSLETVSSTNSQMPANWSHNAWGTNTAQFTYENNGQSGSRSVKVNVTNYVDGDAKWYFDPINNLEAGQQYTFTAWYKSDVLPEIVTMFTKADGTTQYFGMPDPVASLDSATSWQQYSNTFTVPADTVGASVFMLLNKNGWLQTDNYNIVPYQPTGFDRPLVTLTFDDGHEDNVTTALPLLNQYGFKSTQCFATDFIEGRPNEVQNVLDFFNSGHEICSHTVSHPFLTSLDSLQLNYELSHSKQVLESITQSQVLNFASPYGDYSSSVNAVIDDYYQSHRTVDEGYNSKDNFDIYRLRVQNVLNTTTLSEYQGWLNHAKSTNTWLILVYHRVASDAGLYDSYPQDFAAQLLALKNSGLTIKTYQGALEEVQAQF